MHADGRGGKVTVRRYIKRTVHLNCMQLFMGVLAFFLGFSVINFEAQLFGYSVFHKFKALTAQGDTHGNARIKKDVP